MAIQTQVSLVEYLETTYRPAREYIDGELRERNGGKYEHARVQALLTIWFGIHEKGLGHSGDDRATHSGSERSSADS